MRKMVKMIISILVVNIMLLSVFVGIVQATNKTILTASQLIGTWEGQYDGTTGGGDIIVRKILVGIQSCDASGNIVGAVEYSTPGDSSYAGAYSFSGKYDFETGQIEFKGTNWIGGTSVSFAPFEG